MVFELSAKVRDGREKAKGVIQEVKPWTPEIEAESND